MALLSRYNKERRVCDQKVVGLGSIPELVKRCCALEEDSNSLISYIGQKIHLSRWPKLMYDLQTSDSKIPNIASCVDMKK